MNMMVELESLTLMLMMLLKKQYMNYHYSSAQNI